MTATTLFDCLRLIVALGSLGMIVTTVTRSHSLKVWMIALAATEFGHWFALVPLTVVITGTFQPFSLVATFLALLAIVGFYAPAFQAWRMSAGLPARFQAAFDSPVDKCRFSWVRLFIGSRSPAIRGETLIYDEKHQLRLNFYRSCSSQPSPCVIVLHTGGWGNGAPEEFLAFNAHLARKGYAVAAIQYRLAPKWGWPAPREDVRSALHYLRAHCIEFGIDPDQFALLGRSAGGQIAEAVSYLEPDLGFRGCIAFYAPSDMRFSYRLGREADILKSPTLLRNYLGGTPDERRETYHEASPILQVRPDVPPTLLLHGIRDSLVWYRQSERLAKVLRAASVRHLYLGLPWATHAFDYNHDGPAGQISQYAVDSFLRSIFRNG